MAYQNPLSAVCLAILVGCMLQDLRAEYGLKNRARGAYHKLVQNVTFPNEEMLDELVMDMDVYEYGAIAVSLVAVAMGVIHNNMEEFQLPILLTGAFYIRHYNIQPRLDILDSKKPDTGGLRELRVWSTCFGIALCVTLYVHVRGLFRKGSPFSVPLVPVSMGVFTGALLRDVLIDNMTTIGWLFQARYYKELSAASYGLNYVPVALYAIIGLTAVHKLFSGGRNLILDALTLACFGGLVFFTLEKVQPIEQNLHHISKTLKGTENKAAREEQGLAAIGELTEVHVPMLGLAVTGCLIAIISCYMGETKMATK